MMAFRSRLIAVSTHHACISVQLVRSASQPDETPDYMVLASWGSMDEGYVAWTFWLLKRNTRANNGPS
jgi:hypothetical protein